MIKRIFINGTKNPKIKNIIIHHSAGNDCRDWQESKVRRVISDIGYNRGYKRYGYDEITGIQKAWNCSKCNTLNYMGCDKCSVCKKAKTWEPLKFIGFNPLKDPIMRLPTFSMYHFVIYPYNNDFKFVNMILKPLYYDSGSTRNVKVNQISVALCFLGNYKYKTIDPKALKCAAKSLKGIAEYTNKKLNIIGHKDVQKTECPGKIYNQLNILRELLGVKNA